MKVQVCRDVTLASERILCVEIFHRRFFAWVDGSPAVGYRAHVSRHLDKDWWLITRSGQYARHVPNDWQASAPGGAGSAPDGSAPDGSAPGVDGGPAIPGEPDVPQ
jgi:hypothetical protein